MKTILLTLVLMLSTLSLSSENFTDKFFSNYQSEYCENNQYNCLFDGSVSSYSAGDYIKQKYRFIELYFVKQNFESAAFEACGSRNYNPTLSIEHRQNSSIKGRCITWKFINDSTANSLLDDKSGLFNLNPGSKVDLKASSGYLITIAFPKDFYQATGGVNRNLGVHFYINLNNKKDLDNYCSNKNLIASNYLPSSIKKITTNNPNATFNEIAQIAKKDYSIFYRIYLKNLEGFIPSNSSDLGSECVLIKKTNKDQRKAIVYKGKNIINKISTKEEML
jgi:hypothetical protein